METAAFHKQLVETVRLALLAIRMIWRANPRLMVGLLALLSAQALLAPLLLLLAKMVIDRAAHDFRLGGHGDALALTIPLSTWIALAAATLALQQLIPPVSRILQGMAGDRLTGHFSEQIIQATNAWRGIARFEDPALADDLERVRTGMDRKSLVLLLQGASATLQLLTAGGFLLILARLHPLAPLVLLIAGIPEVIFLWSNMEAIGSHLYYKAPDARRLEYDRETVLAIEPAKDVRLYRLGPFFSRRYTDLFDRTVTSLDQLRVHLALWGGAARLLAGAGGGAIYLYTVTEITRGHLPVGDLLLYGGAAMMVRGSIDRLGTVIAFWPAKFGWYLPSLQRVLEMPPDISTPRHPLPVPRPFRQGIMFDDVVFQYPGTDVPILCGVSFHLRPAESLALVGHNGAGKSTIVKLLLRFYDPTAGRILLDGRDLCEYDLEDLRHQMGAIFQDFVHYQLSARENIGLGQVDALEDTSRLMKAVAKAGAMDLIARLPHGLETRLGLEFGGREVSGGEWQKLALARAFVRDCQLLVLDEPTAALDVETEHAVYKQFSELTRGRMTLLISHRLSTVRMADRIIYVRDGRVQEEGRHEDLMELSGNYAHLYNLQAAQYLQED